VASRRLELAQRHDFGAVEEIGPSRHHGRPPFHHGRPVVQGDDVRLGVRQDAFGDVEIDLVLAGLKQDDPVSQYYDHMLQYWYEQGASMHQPEMRGYTEMYFFPVDSVAQRHAGRYLDPPHTHDIRFYAKKRYYRFFQWRRPKAEHKLEAAQAVWQEIEPRLGYLRGRTVSADFL
jgi:hypothetical protein